MTDIQNRLKITSDKLDAINEILLNPEMEVINDFLEVVAKYGTPEEINAKANEARKPENLLALVKKTSPNHLEDLKSNQGGGAVIPGEKFCAQQSPEGCIGIIVAHIYGDLKLVIHSQSVKQVAQKHRAGIDVQYLADTVGCVVVEEFIQPL